MIEWAFISNHGVVLAYIATHPDSTTREIALATKVTEWTVHKIINDLEKEGYLTRRKVGRRNSYTINPELPLKQGDASVRDLLEVLGWKNGSGTR